MAYTYQGVQKEAGFAIDKQLWVISNTMLFKTSNTMLFKTTKELRNKAI